jgi:thioesterase domain-containing protein
MNVATVEAYLHEHIPISTAMGIGVVRADLDGVELRAPLAANINHRSTVFGGSAASVAILAAWTLVHLWTETLPGAHRVVIRRSQVEYLHPITATFTARCEAPPPDERDRLLDGMRRHRQVGVTLEAELISRGRVVGRYTGVYAVLRLDGHRA